MKTLKEITLCARGKCCPKIAKVQTGEKTLIRLADDFGGTSFISEEQAQLLIQELPKLLKSQ